MMNEALKNLIKDYVRGLEIMNRAEKFFQTLEKEEFTNEEIDYFMSWYYHSKKEPEEILKMIRES